MVSFPGLAQNGLNRFSVGTGMVPLQYRSKTDCVQLLEREKALSRRKKLFDSALNITIKRGVRQIELLLPKNPTVMI